MIIAFGHKKHVGKDLAASYLCQNYAFMKARFAFRLKQGVKSMFNIHDVESQEGKDTVHELTGLTHRELLQRTGDAMRREFGDDIFAKLLNIELLCERMRTDKLVIADLRTISEAKYLKQYEDAYLVKIVRTTGSTESHATEHELNEFDGWDAVVDNNGTEVQLYKKLDVILQGWGLRKH